MNVYSTQAGESIDLIAFKKLPQTENPENIEIPESAKNRVPTDREFFIIFGLVVVIFFSLTIYTLVHSNIDRNLGYGYDSCGNVCGKNNTKYNQWNCTGMDFTNKSYLMILEEKCDDVLLCSRQCVYLGEEIPLKDVEHAKYVGWRLVVACFLCLGSCVLTLYLFRIKTTFMVWAMLLITITFWTTFVGVYWQRYSQELQTRYLVGAIFCSVLLMISVFAIIFLCNEIAIITVLLRETMKQVASMWQLLLIPTLISVTTLIILIIFAKTLISMKSAGVLTELKGGNLYYKLNGAMYFSIIFTFWMVFCASQFFSGIQCMTVSGAVTKWYFSRQKDHQISYLRKSACTAFRFHLGTIALGSMVLPFVWIMHALIFLIAYFSCVKTNIYSTTSVILERLKIFSRKAYILTAMHGKPFYKSGNRANLIVRQHLAKADAINCMVGFILLVAHLWVVLTSLLFTYLITPESHPYFKELEYFVVAVACLIVANIYFSVIGTMIDTTLLCFCEDKILNQGTETYAASKELMEFIYNSSKLFAGWKCRFCQSR